MPLLMINGPCGVGKSETSAWLESHIQGSQWIRLDDVRKTIPEDDFVTDGKPDAVARMWHANVIGRSMASNVLAAGNTAIVDAIKYQEEWVDPWVQMGKDLGASVLDICLIAPKPVVEARALARGYKPGGRLTPDKVSRLYDQVEDFYRDRRGAIIINNQHRTVAQTGQIILDLHEDAAQLDKMGS